MQHDLGFAALPVQVGDVIRAMIPVVTEQYGIQVSMDKRVEDEAVIDGPPPNHRVLYIGADFECAGVDRPVHRGQDKSIKRFDQVMTGGTSTNRESSYLSNCLKQLSVCVCSTVASKRERADISTAVCGIYAAAKEHGAWYHATGYGTYALCIEEW